MHPNSWPIDPKHTEDLERLRRWDWDYMKYKKKNAGRGVFKYFWGICLKVEKILASSLNSILSPLRSVKIQITGGKICLKCKGEPKLRE